jgi:hypothetical protein
MLDSQLLVLGQVYTRLELKELFGVFDATQKNGVFPRKNAGSVWLFVTRDMTADRTQYLNSLDGDVLVMQGQTMGRTDSQIINHASDRVELLLFYRNSKAEHPGAGFVYEGPFLYKSHAGSAPTTFTLARASVTTRRDRQWEMVLASIIALGGRATRAEIREYARIHHPMLNLEGNLDPDLLSLSVNSPSRTSYSPNHQPRRTDVNNRYDRLFKRGSGRDTVFEIYDHTSPEHGIWEIFRDEASTNKHGVSIRRFDQTEAALDQAGTEADAAGAFDVTNIADARRKTYVSIVQRRGQRTFRKLLLSAYHSRCAVTGCAVEAILEAAHIYPYQGDATNLASNGLLLRADIHTLFDLKLLSFDPESLTIFVSPELHGTEYGQYHATKLRPPSASMQQPSVAALRWHRDSCMW